MSLRSGTRLGPYDILAPLGAGGMGEVYRATDTKLGRDVAIKVLPTEVAGDAERLARFQREATLLAALNHPHIAAIHGLEEEAGTPFLVLELVEGEDLAERLKRGLIPVDEALEIARQIAEALEAAHEKGIVHRDLKPANVKVTPDDQVKVLDFGLAKAWEGDPVAGSSSGLSQSPTLAHSGTQAGVILGTAAYMSPEQARGKPVDKRADIWAFGVVLFEMLTGQRPFQGETVSDVLASVMKDQPDWSRLPEETPAAARRLLRRCLEKNPKNRLHAVADARLELVEPSSGERAEAAAVTEGRPIRSGLWPWVAGTLAVALGLALWSPWRPSPLQAPRALHLEIRLGSDLSREGGRTNPGPAIALAPGGDLLAFIGRDGEGPRRVYTRRLDELEASPLSGTEGARNPFFSPDGEWIAFFTDRSLRKIPANGGASTDLCETGIDSRGGTWGPDGTILLAPHGEEGGGLWRVRAAGGSCEPFTTPDQDANEATHRWPQWLPGGRAVLYTAHETIGGYEDAHLVVESVSDRARTVVHRGGYHGRYLPSGHLLWIHEGTLFAAPFDVDALEIQGTPVPVVGGVAADPTNAGAQFAFSESGRLAYLAATRVASLPLHWLPRDGTLTPLWEEPKDWSGLRFSPAGDRLALALRDGGPPDLWLYDWSRHTSSRLTFSPRWDSVPVWTPDGRRIVFASRRDGTANLYWRPAGGTGDVQRLTKSENSQYPASWHPDGRRLAFMEQNPETGYDMMLLELEGDEETGWTPGTPTVLLRTRFEEGGAQFSPDGRWLAYTSRETGRPEVYVQSFPGPGGKWLVSTAGGVEARWSRTRPEIVYARPDRTLWVVPYTTDGDTLRPGAPTRWSDVTGSRRPDGGSFDLHPDGERIALGVAPVESRDSVFLVTGFFDELRRLTAEGGE